MAADPTHPLRAYLRAKGETLEGFGARAGLSASQLSRIIAGKRYPSLRAARKIIAAAEGEIRLADLVPPDLAA